MNTRILKSDIAGIKTAAQYLKAGEVVAFPTETVYGLGANALCDDAVQKIFEAKNRPSDNPIIVHIASVDDATKLVAHIPVAAKMIMEKYWPGPISIILESKPHISKYVTAGLGSVALRCPDNSVALALISAADVPIAAPSANISGKPSGTLVQHVIRDFDGKIAAIIDGGSCEVGLESTVVDARTTPVRVLRPGAITLEMLNLIVPAIIDKGNSGSQPISPGTKYPHYNPKAIVTLVTGESLLELRTKIKDQVLRYNNVALLGVVEVVKDIPATKVLAVGTMANLEAYAENLYSFFRSCDEENIDHIIVHQVPEEGLGLALMNRIKKAANEILGDDNEDITDMHR